jgi:hypothetical protein
VKYAWIEKHRQTYSTTMMCDLLSVSRSGLNAARARPSSKDSLINSPHPARRMHA